MKKNAKADKPFTLNVHVRERLEKWDDINRKYLTQIKRIKVYD